MSPVPVFVRIPGSHHPGTRLRLVPGFRDPGAVLILGQVTQYGNPYLICITNVLYYWSNSEYHPYLSGLPPRHNHAIDPVTVTCYFVLYKQLCNSAIYYWSNTGYFPHSSIGVNKIKGWLVNGLYDPVTFRIFDTFIKISCQICFANVYFCDAVSEYIIHLLVS